MNLQEENECLRERIRQLETLLKGEDWQRYLPLGLQARTAATLAALMHRASLTQEQIRFVIADNGRIDASDNLITVHIYRIRKALRKLGLDIDGRPRLGYSLSAKTKAAIEANLERIRTSRETVTMAGEPHNSQERGQQEHFSNLNSDSPSHRNGSGLSS